MPMVVQVLPPMPEAMRTGLCTSGRWPADLWSEGGREARRIAREVCAACPARPDCLEWSLSLPGADTALWAGLTVSQRLAERKRRRAALPPPGMARRNAAKDRCDHGHELAGDNLLLLRDPRDGRSYRQCRECRRRRSRIAARLRSARRREAAA